MDMLSEVESCIAESAIVRGNNKNYIKENSTEIQLKTKGTFLNCNFEDVKQPHFPLFNKDIKGLCSIADSVIFTERKGVLWVLIFEIKEKKCNQKSQLIATKLFVEYLLKSIDRVYRRKIKYEIRLLGYSEKIRPTTKNRPKYQDGYMQIGRLKELRLNNYLV